MVSGACHSGDVVGHVLRGVRWVVFDVGETLVDESRLWEATAEQCGVSVATVCGVLGGLIERGEDYHRCGTCWASSGLIPETISTRNGLRRAAGDYFAEGLWRSANPNSVREPAPTDAVQPEGPHRLGLPPFLLISAVLA